MTVRFAIGSFLRGRDDFAGDRALLRFAGRFFSASEEKNGNESEKNREGFAPASR